MSSLNVNTADVDAVNYSTNMFYQFWSYLLFCFGTVGHSFSIYVFTRPTLYSNPCVRYFLAATITGIFVTYVNILLRLLQNAYNIDVFGYSSGSCKILTFAVYWAKAQTSWFIALSCVDRFLCSSRSVNMRSWSNVRIASRITLLAILLVSLALIYVPVQYYIEEVSHKCSMNYGNYPVFYGIWHLIVFSIGPSVIMLIFGSLTIRHVRQSVRRVIPQNIQAQTVTVSALQVQLKRQKMADRQLTQMMIIQSVYFILISIPTSIYWLYDATRPNVVPDALESAKNNSFSIVTGILSLTGACTSFYLFTLSSKLFRLELMHLFKSQWQLNRQTIENEIPLRRRN